MIGGRVDSARDAVVGLVVRGPSGQKRAIEAVIDTGFTDEITLPKAVIDELQLPSDCAVEVTLADGQTVFVDLHECDLAWFGAQRTVRVLAMEGDPLVGMALLRGHWLKMHVVPDGPVSIE